MINPSASCPIVFEILFFPRLLNANYPSFLFICGIQKREIILFLKKFFKAYFSKKEAILSQMTSFKWSIGESNP